MEVYQQLLEDVVTNGTDRSDRTGVGTRSVFGRQVRYNLREGFPLVTTKRIHWKSVVRELLWIISGDTNVEYLQSHGVRIWNEWADENGDLGPVYGHQWRHWGGDQLATVVASLRNDPYSRRHVVSAWNVSDVPSMALPPCHTMFQFWVNGSELSCQLYQRSADIFLGVPFNIASYALLTHMVAEVVGLKAAEFIHSFGDLHLYHNHMQQAHVQLQREPRKLPRLRLKPVATIDDFRFEHVELLDYNPHPTIKATVAV